MIRSIKSLLIIGDNHIMLIQALEIQQMALDDMLSRNTKKEAPTSERSNTNEFNSVIT